MLGWCLCLWLLCSLCSWLHCQHNADTYHKVSLATLKPATLVDTFFVAHQHD